MKKLRLLILVTALAVLLSGCQLFLPFFYLNLLDSGESAVQETLPIGSDVAANLEAEDVFYRAKFAGANRAYQYREQMSVDYAPADDVSASPIRVQQTRNITLSDTDCAVNVITEIHSEDYPELDTTDQSYYREENGTLILYYANPEEDLYVREPIPLEEYTPYAIIVDFTVYGCPYIIDNLTLEPQTRILNGREVYMLTYSQSALYTFGATGNESTDAQLNKRNIPATWYVDAETFLPVRQEFVLTQVDDLLWRIMDRRYGIGTPDYELQLTRFALTCDYESFDPVEVPPIPEDVLQKAWQNSGSSAG